MRAPPTRNVRPGIDAGIVSIALRDGSRCAEKPAMIFEIAQIEIQENREQEFERAVAEAKPLIERAPGCHGLRLYRGIEQPSRYRLMVQWESVALHDAFRQTADFQRWRELAGPFFVGPPSVEHVSEVRIAGA
ncbi:antibiotic biosynthesis monooxygenase family protein [Burkholderia cepacia]|uniref:antibiotic biosynthesis monooxygenase family protein n=1 Tax=Burkholderia cepacia TaxID=292 RepID=UPI0038BDB3E6